MARQQDTDRSALWWRRIAESPHALGLFFVASFLEAIIVPIPIEALLVPYMLYRRERIWLTATVVLAGCLLAALVGYGLGFFLFESVGQWFLDAMHYNEQFAAFQERFTQQGFWAILIVGVVPIPFQLAMLAAGIAGYPLALFLLAALIARGVRYYGLALMLALFGDAAVRAWQRLPRATGLGLVAAVVAAYLVIRYWVL
jgi:membrane protein YqaA with SNARE-associated domain